MTSCTTTPRPTPPRSRIRHRPSGRTGPIVRLLPLGMAATVAVDVLLGEAAEYFNAASLLRAWGSTVVGNGIGDHEFIIGQAEMGDAIALAVGTAAWVIEPAVVLAVLVQGISALRRWARPRRAD